LKFIKCFEKKILEPLNYLYIYELKHLSNKYQIWDKSEYKSSGERNYKEIEECGGKMSNKFKKYIYFLNLLDILL